MLGIFLILLFCIFLAFIFPIKSKKKEEAKKRNPKFDFQIKKLWSIAQSSMRERKPVRAEKALLTILKFDEKNAAAYNRLGILYAKDQRFDEAIECFEIAQSLDSNASSLHNAGLIYLETGAYEKAIMAFKQALELEGDVPARYIALAKAEERVGNRKNAVSALESAYDIDSSANTLRQILAIYESLGDTEKITATTARLEAQVAKEAEERKLRAAKRDQQKQQKQRRLQQAVKSRQAKIQAKKRPIRTARSSQSTAAAKSTQAATSSAQATARSTRATARSTQPTSGAIRRPTTKPAQSTVDRSARPSRSGRPGRPKPVR